MALVREKGTVKFMDEAPTNELRAFLRDVVKLQLDDVQEDLQLDRLLEEIDRATDWWYSQNTLNKNRLRAAETEKRASRRFFWRVLLYIERLCASVEKAAREERWLLNARERERLDLERKTDGH